MQAERPGASPIEAQANTTEGQPLGFRDEVRLVDILKIFYRQRWWMLGTFLLVLVAAAAYYTVAPLKYKVSTSVVVPDDPTNSPNPLERIDTVKGRVMLFYGPQMRPDQPGLPDPDGIAFTASGNKVFTLALVVRQKEIPHAVNWLNKINGKLKEHWQEVRGALAQQSEVEADSLRSQDDSLNSVLKVLQQKRSESKDDASQVQLDAQIGLIKQQLSDNLSKLQPLELNLQLLKIPPSIAAAAPSKDPVSPKLRLTVVLAFAGGIVMAVLLALTRDFWMRNRNEIRSTD